MRIQITSSRGHHEAETDTAVAEVVFNKLTGKRHAALPPEVRTKVPDTWHELDALWQDGTVSGYTAISKKGDASEIIGLQEFDPQAGDLMFMSPISGG